MRFAEALHATTLGLWGGTLLASGITAAIIFPTLRDANVHLPAFAHYDDAHWPIAAGQVMNRVFHLVDGLGIGALTIALLTLVLSMAKRTTRHIGASTAVRTIALGMLLVVTVYAIVFLRPAMQAELHAYWSAAQASDSATATTHRIAFDELHPTATFTMTAQLILIIIALCAGVMCAAVRPAKQEYA